MYFWPIFSPSVLSSRFSFIHPFSNETKLFPPSQINAKVLQVHKSPTLLPLCLSRCRDVYQGIIKCVGNSEISGEDERWIIASTAGGLEPKRGWELGESKRGCGCIPNSRCLTPGGRLYWSHGFPLRRYLQDCLRGSIPPPPPLNIMLALRCSCVLQCRWGNVLRGRNQGVHFFF